MATIKETMEAIYKSAFGNEGEDMPKEDRFPYRALDIAIRVDENGQVTDKNTGINVRILTHAI